MIINIRDVEIELENLDEGQYAEIRNLLAKNLSDKAVKNRDAIATAFSRAVTVCPKANPSDLWHHIVYREYISLLQKYRIIDDPGQSWKRASGDAFELFLEGYYNTYIFRNTNVRLVALLGKRNQIDALKRLGIYGKVGDSKLDMAILAQIPLGEGILKPLTINDGEIIGGIHAKVSLAERVSDDVPASELMMEKGFFSILATLDVKSFPLSETMTGDRAYCNKGELGTQENPTDKRKYIEEHGSFDMCISYNLRTNQTIGKTISGKSIYVSDFSREPDPLYNFMIDNFRDFQTGE